MFGNLDTRSIVFNLIMINILAFVVTQLVGEKMYELFALFYPASPFFKPWQLLTHLFMHGNFMHILSNMFALFMFGSVLERVWGPKRFLLFYLITGFGAVVLHTAVQAFLVHKGTGAFAPSMFALSQSVEALSIYQTPTVGASGAIFGILIGFGMMFPNTELMMLFFPIPIKAKYFVALYVVLELYLGVSMYQGDNVAHFAHLGGALFGFLLVKYWNAHRDNFY